MALDWLTQAYIQELIQTRDLIALTNDDSSNATTINATVINSAMEQAEAFVKGYVQTKYELPFVVIPELVKNIARSMSLYYLYERKRNITNSMQLSYENDIQKLKDIAKGVITLDTAPEVNPFQTKDTQKLMYVDDYTEAPFQSDKLDTM